MFQGQVHVHVITIGFENYTYTGVHLSNAMLGRRIHVSCTHLKILVVIVDVIFAMSKIYRHIRLHRYK